MRPFALIFFALFSSVFTLSQTVQKRIFQHSRIKVEPTERSRFPYLKPDTSYYFTCYHKFGNQEITGFLEIDGRWFGRSHGMETPDTKKDPDGSKGIMKDTFNYYFENGSIDYEWEYDPGGIVSTGGWYGRGKNGKWFSGFLLKSKLEGRSYFVKTKKQVYKEDQLDSTSLIEFNSISWPEIKGTWVENQEFSNDSVILYHPANNVNSEPSIEFINDKQYYLRNNYLCGVPKWINEWWAIGDRLFLKIGRSTHEYKIISFTGSELVIQLVSAKELHY